MDDESSSSVTETLVDILLCSVPPIMIGLLIGWSWRPRWTGLVYLGLRSKLRFLCTVPPGFGARRVWLAFTALSLCRTLWSSLGSSDKKPEDSGATEAISRLLSMKKSICSFEFLFFFLFTIYVL